MPQLSQASPEDQPRHQACCEEQTHMRMTQSSQARAASELPGWNASLEAGEGSASCVRQLAARKSQMRSQLSRPTDISSLLLMSPATPVTARSWALLDASWVSGEDLQSGGGVKEVKELLRLGGWAGCISWRQCAGTRYEEHTCRRATKGMQGNVSWPLGGGINALLVHDRAG